MSVDFNNQSASNMQMERPSPWPPVSRENTAGAQLPTPPSLGPGPPPVGNQPPRPPVSHLLICTYAYYSYQRLIN